MRSAMVFRAVSVTAVLAIGVAVYAANNDAADKKQSAVAASTTPALTPVPSATPTRSTLSSAKPKPVVTKSASVIPLHPTTSAAPVRPAYTTSTPRTSAPPPATSTAPRPAQLPLAGSTAGASQVITVTAPAYGTTTGTLQAWTRVAGGWRPLFDNPVSVWLGGHGFTTNAREGFDGTPVGDFPITQAFGNNSNPGTALPYFHDDQYDWWDGDIHSPTYNSHQRCAGSQPSGSMPKCPFDLAASEHLQAVGYVYSYAIVIDYNMFPVVPGKGSAFFLHVTNNEPTAGCVSMPAGDLVRLLQWVTPTAHPRLIMGVN